MKQIENTYYCKYCKKTLRRKSDKKWIKSFCSFINKDVIIVKLFEKIKQVYEKQTN